MNVWQSRSRVHKHTSDIARLSCGGVGDARRIVSGGHDNSLRVWTVSDSGALSLEFIFKGAHEELLSSVAASPDGRWAASVGHDKRVIVRSAASDWAETQRFESASANSCVTFAHDSRSFVVGGLGPNLQLFTLSDDAQWAHQRDIPTSLPYVGAVAFSPDGGLVAAGGGAGVTFGAVDLVPTAIGGSARTIDLPGDAADVYGLAFAADGRRLAAALGDGRALIIPLDAGDIIDLPGHVDAHGMATAVSFLPDGRLVAAKAAGFLCVWALPAGGEAVATVDTVATKLQVFDVVAIEAGGVPTVLAGLRGGSIETLQWRPLDEQSDYAKDE